jgi:hypothetical protein
MLQQTQTPQRMMLQRMNVKAERFFNKIRMLQRTQMLQRNRRNTIGQRGISTKDIDKEMLPIWAAFLCRYALPRCSIVVHVFRGAAIL